MFAQPGKVGDLGSAPFSITLDPITIIMNNGAKKIVLVGLSNAVARLASQLEPGRDHLLSLAFHSVAGESSEKDSSVLPALALRADNYRTIREHFLEKEYTFVSSGDIWSGLPRGKRYAHVTFDDGYYNNVDILSLLEEYDIPAEIFVTTSNIRKNQKYWWDVVYVQMRRVGKNDSEIADMIANLKRLSYQKIEEHLSQIFGKNAFVPVSDQDRPLTPSELRSLAKERLISIGNHTRDHMLLAGCSAQVVEEQITTAQEEIKEMTGKMPVIFAYPNGSYSDTAIQVLDQLGFELGFSSDLRVNHLSRDVEGKNRLALGRFSFFSTFDLLTQCANFRLASISPIVLAKRAQRAFARSY